MNHDICIEIINNLTMLDTLRYQCVSSDWLNYIHSSLCWKHRSIHAIVTNINRSCAHITFTTEFGEDRLILDIFRNIQCLDFGTCKGMCTASPMIQQLKLNNEYHLNYIKLFFRNIKTLNVYQSCDKISFYKKDDMWFIKIFNFDFMLY